MSDKGNGFISGVAVGLCLAALLRNFSYNPVGALLTVALALGIGLAVALIARRL